MKKKINCETARNLPVEKVLERLGHFPKRATEKEAWFLSPLRSETQASFKVSRTRNRWYDHGEGIGGNVIDLVCRIRKCSVKEALEFLNDGTFIEPFVRPPIFNDKERELEIENVREIGHPALIQYLGSRKIPVPVAKRYCQEVWYRCGDARFFAVGLENGKGGWELRSKVFKNSSSPKSYTYIKRSSDRLIILEGMFDLLSLATLEQGLLDRSSILILNSLSFIRTVAPYVDSHERTFLYLDNDVPGKAAARYLMENNAKVIDKSTTYKNYKDLNTYLCDGR